MIICYLFFLCTLAQYSKCHYIAHEPAVSYLPMHYMIDAQSASEPGTKFQFLLNNKVVMKVTWDGTKYTVEDFQK